MAHALFIIEVCCAAAHAAALGFRVDDGWRCHMQEGTDNRTIDAPNMIFRRVLCSDPYILDQVSSLVSSDTADPPQNDPR